MKSKNLSIERIKYLNKIKRGNFLVTLTQIIILISFIGIWEFLARAEIIDSFITSQPSRILDTFINLKSNDLLVHIGVTTYETIVGFLFGTVLGIIVAIILWWSKFLERVLDPFLVVLNSLPKVALRSNYNVMIWSWIYCYCCYGNGNFTCSNYFRNFKWI